MVDQATFSVVRTPAAAQPPGAGTSTSIDAMFGALLQSMNEQLMTADTAAPAVMSSAQASAGMPVTNFAAAAMLQTTTDATKPTKQHSQANQPAPNALGQTQNLASPMFAWTAVKTPASAANTTTVTPDQGPAQSPTDPAASTNPAASGDTTMSATELMAMWQMAPQTAATPAPATPASAPQNSDAQNAATVASDAAAAPVKTNTSATAPQPRPNAPTNAAPKTTSSEAPREEDALVPAAPAPSAMAAPAPAQTQTPTAAAPKPANVQTAAASVAAPQVPGVADQAVQPANAEPQQSTADDTDQQPADASAPVNATTPKVADQAPAQTSPVPEVVSPIPAAPAAAPQVVAQQAPARGKSDQASADSTTAAAVTQALNAPRVAAPGEQPVKTANKTAAPKAHTDKTPRPAGQTDDADTVANIKAGETANPAIAPHRQSETAQTETQPAAQQPQTASAQFELPQHHTAKPETVTNPAIPQADPTQTAAQKPAVELQVAPQHHANDATTGFDKLGVTIAAKTLEGLHEFDIRLDPPELGRIQVKLTVDDRGQAQATLVADKQQTLDLLQRDASTLNKTLHDAGLNLANNGLNFSLREHQQQNDSPMGRGRSRSMGVKAVIAADPSALRAPSGSYAPNSARLDIRV